jgi:hypothetical protein
MLEPGPDRLRTREDIYGVRRLLISRLQQATRGVPRSTRAESLQLFAREWRELGSTNRLEDLVGILEGREPRNPVPEFLVKLALNTEQELPGAAAPAACSPDSPTAAVHSRKAGGEPNSKLWWVGNRQEELFPAGLAPQPV